MKTLISEKNGYKLYREDNYYLIYNDEMAELAKLHFILRNDMIVLWYRMTQQWIWLDQFTV